MVMRKEYWFIKTHELMGQYPIMKKRIVVLENHLIRETSRGTRLVQQFGTPTGSSNVVDKEQELEEYKVITGEIDIALSVLNDEERGIIEAKYFRELKDYMIYQQEFPMGVNKFYRIWESAILKIAKVLGMV